MLGNTLTPAPHPVGSKALAHVRANGSKILNEHELKALFAAYDINSANETKVQDWAEAQRVAHEIRYSIPLKAFSADVTHKTDAGLVVLISPLMMNWLAHGTTSKAMGTIA